MIRLVIVDDHPVLREGLRVLLATEPDLHVVGEAANGQLLLDQLLTTPADVVLLDWQMPVLDGLATARQLHATYPRVRILMLSMAGERFHIEQALAAGVHGYVLKSAPKQELVAGIHAVAGGKQFLSAEAPRSWTPPAGPVAPPTQAGATRLSHREREILQLVVAGQTTQQIADQLFTSPRTVETHRQRLLEKTGCANTAALIRWASTHQFLN